jgi:hypothetical protein
MNAGIGPRWHFEAKVEEVAMPLTVAVAHERRVRVVATGKPSSKAASGALEAPLHHEAAVIACPKACPPQPTLHNGACTHWTCHDERARETCSGVGGAHEHRLRASGDRGASPCSVNDLGSHDAPRAERDVDPHQVPIHDRQRVSAVDGDAPSNGISNRVIRARVGVGGGATIGFPATVVASTVIVRRDGSWAVYEQRHGQKRAVRGRARACRSDDQEPDRDRGEADRVVPMSTCALCSTVDAKSYHEGHAVRPHCTPRRAPSLSPKGQATGSSRGFSGRGEGAHDAELDAIGIVGADGQREFGDELQRPARGDQGLHAIP